MNFTRHLLTTVFVATAAFANVPPPVKAAPIAPTLLTFTFPGGVAWFTRDAYYVTISPGTVGDLPSHGFIPLGSGSYTVRAVGEAGREVCRVIRVR